MLQNTITERLAHTAALSPAASGFRPPATGRTCVAGPIAVEPALVMGTSRGRRQSAAAANPAAPHRHGRRQHRRRRESSACVNPLQARCTQWPNTAGRLRPRPRAESRRYGGAPICRSTWRSREYGTGAPRSSPFRSTRRSRRSPRITVRPNPGQRCVSGCPRRPHSLCRRPCEAS